MNNEHMKITQGIGERLPMERPESCGARAIAAVGTGLVAGGITGAVTANWGNVPPVLADRPWPALKHTGAALHLAAAKACPPALFCRLACKGMHCMTGKLFCCSILQAPSWASTRPLSRWWPAPLPWWTASPRASEARAAFPCPCHQPPACSMPRACPLLGITSEA